MLLQARASAPAPTGGHGTVGLLQPRGKGIIWEELGTGPQGALRESGPLEPSSSSEGALLSPCALGCSGMLEPGRGGEGMAAGGSWDRGCWPGRFMPIPGQLSSGASGWAGYC